MTPQKRRRLERRISCSELSYDGYHVTSVSLSPKPVVAAGASGHGAGATGVPPPTITSCHSDYQIYDMSAGMDTSPPPCHPATFQYNAWRPTDVLLHVGELQFRAHKDHLSACARYFGGMFGHNMREAGKREITLHSVDEASFRAILTSFYTGFLSVCSECVVRILKTGTFLQSEVIMGVCENYILTHMTLKSVFSHLEISQELGYDKISRQAQQLICANLGPPSSLTDTEDFLTLSPHLMSLILSDFKTNCSETALAEALFHWAERAWELLEASPGSTSSLKSLMTSSSSLLTSSSPGGCSSSSLNDSGIVVSEEYVVELTGSGADHTFDIPEPRLPAPPGHLSQPAPPGANEFPLEIPSPRRRHSKTYKRRRGSPCGTSKRHRDRSHSEERARRGEEKVSKKRKREQESESENARLSAAQQARADVENVLMKIEYRNMEVETLRSFLNEDIVSKIPSLYNYIKRLTTTVQYKCVPERGTKPAVSLCYNRCYRSNENPSRTLMVYYMLNGRWHLLNHTFDINLISVKSLVVHDFLYVFGMHKTPGQQAVPRAFRFNQFTGVWREISAPPHSFNSNARVLAHNDSILMIGATNIPAVSAGLNHFQQGNVKILQYTPQIDSWRELGVEMEITNYQLQRYVNSIINHEGILYYVSKNKLFSFDIGSDEPGTKEVAVISLMFTDISNYWLFGYQDKIILLGGLCTVQGGGSWQNREILIYSRSSRTWNILQNHKPSPMYEMMSAMVQGDKIYTVNHSASGGDSMAKIEIFDIARQKWRKGTNLKYESPIACLEYGLTLGRMLVKTTDLD